MRKKKERERQRNNQQVIQDTHLDFVDMHDGKMGYCLTGHVLWNRTHHPYMLCKCMRGEGVQNNKTHVCELISHKDQIKYFERSKRRLDRKRADVGEIYTDKKHMDWCDEHNYGITHYPIHPDELPRDCIAFDMFHMKCAITRSSMNYTRDFVLSQSTEFIDLFKTHLRRFWGEYHLFVWNSNKPFASFHGNELAMWVKNIPATIALIRSHFDDTEHLKHLYQFLESWHSLPAFLGITKIKEDADKWYKNQMSEYVKNVTKLYDAGAKTVLTRNNTGDRETFYMHVLCYYVPQIAKKTHDTYGVGMGVYTMQGYERRNKESKNTLRRFNNNRGNIVVPNLKRLWDIFHYSINAY